MKSKLITLFWSIIGASFFTLFAVIGVIFYFSLQLPKISSLEDYRPSVPSKILANDGTVLAQIGKEKRMIANIDEIPQVIIDAFLAAEDDNFYNHTGVDYWGVLRAFLVNLKAGKIVQGGSTITQQVAKSLLLTSERSISRKIKDLLLAQRIEKKFSKKEILFLYLNQVYFGGGYHGIKSAFNGYYGKSLDKATIAESAMMAGLLVRPAQYSPYINPKFAKKRQAYVLKRMLVTGKINQDDYENAIKENIKFNLRKKAAFKAGYFTDWVRQRAVHMLGNDSFLSGGFTIKTTLDWTLQKEAEKQVQLGVKKIDKRQGFKGPIGHLSTEEKVREFEVNFRKKTLKNDSTFFTIADDSTKRYEFEFNEEEFLRLVQLRSSEKYLLPGDRIPFGLLKEDKFIEHLKVGESYKAVVKRIDDKARIIYFSIGGIPGVIPYDYFKWAHKRLISEKRNYFTPIKKPSRILKKNDLILVKLTSKKSRLWKNLYKDYRKKIKDKDFIKECRNQFFLRGVLDQKADAQGALLTIHPKTGKILAFVGGKNFEESQFNRVIQSKRQPGSSFKPLLFAAGLEHGYTPSTVIIDSPEALAGVDESLNWKPRNYDGKFKGPLTFRNALEQSRNVPTIKIAEKIGVSTIKDFVKRVGLEVELEEDLSLALGSFGVSLLDIVATYGIFPNQGKRVFPQAILEIVDRDGTKVNISDEFGLKKQKLLMAEKEKVEEEKEENEDTNSKEFNVKEFLLSLGGSQVYDQRLAFIMTNLLKGVVLHGTGRGAKSVSPFLGGKTGTTNSYVDAWFIGFSANLVTGVWTGFDDNKTLGWGETGAKSALPIWKGIMKKGIKRYGEQDFQAPLGIINVLVDKNTGKLVKKDSKDTFAESFVEGMEPREDDLITHKENDVFGEDDYYNNQ